MNISEDFKNNFSYDLNEYYIVYEVFDRLLRDDFIKDVGYLEQGMGLDIYGVIGYYLPSIFESKDEEGYFNDGVMLYVCECDIVNEIKISYDMFLNCLKAAFRVYSKYHSIDDFDFDSKIKTIKNQFEKFLSD